MPLGSELLANFKKASNGYLDSRDSVREVDLFRFLLKAFENLNNYSVGEIHGNKRQVVYNTSNDWFENRTPQCELGDVGIIAFSQKRASARIIIIQNKVSRKPHEKFSADSKRVSASLYQFKLLYSRPIFSFVKNPNAGIKNNLICSKEFPSVCQYGIFYKDKDDNIDMSCITADKFKGYPTPSKKRMSKHPVSTIYFDGTFETLATKNKSMDFEAASNLLDFGDLLEQLLIGKPISLSEKKKLEKEVLLKYKKSWGFEATHPYTIIDEFSKASIEEQFDIQQESYFSDVNPCEIFEVCRSVILINVDSKNNFIFNE